MRGCFSIDPETREFMTKRRPMPVSRLYPGLARSLIAVMVSVPFAMPAFATNVVMTTQFGDVEIELLDEETPQTVANFLNYVNDGDYVNSFIHRTVPEFVVQGGGYTFTDGVANSVPTDPPVVNEPGISNTRGTIAMAKISGDPNSATSQWFFNVEDNTDLDSNNGGFTVFGRVVGNGMEAIDQIAALQRWNLGSPFTELPLIDYSGEGSVQAENLVIIDIQVVDPFPINAGLNDAWYNPETSGQGFLIAVYPQRGTMFVAWFTFDAERPPGDVTAILGEPGHRWLTAQGPFSENKGVLDIYVTSGGVFDAGEPAPVPVKDGTMIVEFHDCNSGTITYDIPSAGLQGVIPIERIVLDNVALCQALAEPVVE